MRYSERFVFFLALLFLFLIFGDEGIAVKQLDKRSYRIGIFFTRHCKKRMTLIQVPSFADAEISPYNISERDGRQIEFIRIKQYLAVFIKGDGFPDVVVLVADIYFRFVNGAAREVMPLSVPFKSELNRMSGEFLLDIFLFIYIVVPTENEINNHQER